jgi:hypothetical protein
MPMEMLGTHPTARTRKDLVEQRVKAMNLDVNQFCVSNYYGEFLAPPPVGICGIGGLEREKWDRAENAGVIRATLGTPAGKTSRDLASTSYLALHV